LAGDIFSDDHCMDSGHVMTTRLSTVLCINSLVVSIDAVRCNSQNMLSADEWFAGVGGKIHQICRH
jgi:hypothetical protein